MSNDIRMASGWKYTFFGKTYSDKQTNVMSIV